MRVEGTMHPVGKNGWPWPVKARKNVLEPLDCYLLEDSASVVFKQTLFCEKGRGSVSILFLGPSAKIREHKHLQDSEFYIAWSIRKQFLKVEMCDIGESHELENTSKKNWLWVLSVKFDKLDSKEED